jgi:uncharacterized protein (TIGR03083 family)
VGDELHIGEVVPIGWRETWALAEAEWDRVVDLLGALEPHEWSSPTDCERWDVRALALHLLGTAEMQASPREMLHQFRRGLPLNRVIPSHHWVDGINEFQVRERSTMGNEEVVARLAEVAAMAVVGRRRLPPPIRWAPVPMGPPIGWKPLTYLMRMGFTRDVWMHRVDLARATRREIVLTPQHDGRLVADIVVEWANRHGEPFRLELTGPAGGTYVQEGAGIVADSIPESEHQECLNKAKALFRAAEEAARFAGLARRGQ